MSNVNEIHDDEFRVIGTHIGKTPTPKSKWGVIVKCAIAFMAIIAIIISVVMWLQPEKEKEADNLFDPQMEDTTSNVDISMEPKSDTAAAYIIRDSIVINDIAMDIFVPINAKPALAIGRMDRRNENIILCTQATDVRADNGKITGSFIINGELISHGYSSKWGYCSIIGDSIRIGMAKETPIFEETLNNKGSFFRQHPLIVNGQIYQSTIKGKAIRKALCEIKGKYAVVMTRTRESIHDFSQALHDINAINAIYLVGADSYTFYRNEAGELTEFNVSLYGRSCNVNYIYWTKE